MKTTGYTHTSSTNKTVYTHILSIDEFSKLDFQERERYLLWQEGYFKGRMSVLNENINNSFARIDLAIDNLKEQIK